MPIYEAATIDEAVQLGLADLGLAKDQVEIEILEEGKKGFLGMGRKNARLSIQPSISEKVSETVEQTVEYGCFPFRNTKARHTDWETWKNTECIAISGTSLHPSFSKK